MIVKRIKNKKKKSLKVDCVIFTILLIVVLFLSHGLNIIGWNRIVIGRYYVISAFISYAFFFFYIRKCNVKKNPYSKYAAYLLFWPIVPLLYTSFVGGRFSDELIFGIGVTFPIIFFFVFHKFRIREDIIMKVLTGVALITVGIQIFQQLYPESALFGIIDPESPNFTGKIADMRNGLYRFWVGCYTIQLLCFYYYWQKTLEKFNLIYVILSVLFAVSIYLYLTRQVMIALFICLIISLFRLKSKNKILIILTLFVTGLYLVVEYWDLIFKELVDDYQSNKTTDIRWQGIDMMINLYIADPISAIIGHGHILKMHDYWESRNLYISDIGVIGEPYYYGIIWTIAYLRFGYSLIKNYHNKIPTYILLFVLTTLIICLFAFPYFNCESMFTWASMLYICSIHIMANNNKKKTITRRASIKNK